MVKVKEFDNGSWRVLLELDDIKMINNIKEENIFKATISVK